MQLDMHLGGGVNLTFATPMLARQVPDAERLNRALLTILAERERARPEFRSGGQRASNFGGWRSDPDVFNWPQPEVAELKRHMVQGAGDLIQLAAGPAKDRRARFEFQAAAWVNINRDGAYNIVHNHADQHWSGVYYVSAGQPDPKVGQNGVIEFLDPRGAAMAMPIPGFDFGHQLTIAPQPGMLLAFPSWLLHFVHPFRGAGERISIAFNLKVTKLELVPASG